ncbi:MAG: hypothetical protein MSH66_04945 [Bacteroidales bacterium]|nr:hypothetical protein [Bacteroidales bacterium]
MIIAIILLQSYAFLCKVRTKQAQYDRMIAPRAGFAPPRSLTAGGTVWQIFGERDKRLIFAQAGRGRAQALPLFVFFGANYPI